MVALSRGGPDLRKRVLIGLAVGLAGFAVNSAPLALFPGLHIVFGSALTLAAAIRYGPMVGGVAGLVAGFRTLWLWSEPFPWSALLLCLEGTWVGYFTAPTRRWRPLYAGLLFWAFAGGWNAVGQAVLFQLPWPLAWTVALRSVTNGLFSILLAEALLIAVAFARRNTGPDAFRLSLSATIGLALMLGISVPATVAMVAFARRTRANMIEKAIQGNNVAAGAVAGALHSRLETLQRAVALAADVIETEHFDLRGTERLNRLLDATRKQNPELQGMYVANARAVTVAFSPATSAEGESLLGLDYSDREYFKELRSTGKPVLSGIYQGRGGMTTPTAAAAVPLLGPTGELRGFVLGWFHLESFRNLAQGITTGMGPERVVITDGGALLVADSGVETYATVRSLQRDPVFGLTLASADGVAFYEDPTSVARTALGDAVKDKWWVTWRTTPERWKVLVRTSARRVDEDIAFLHLRTLGALLFLLLGAGAVAHALGSRIARPLAALEDSARRLSSGDLTARPPEVFVATREAHTLTQAFVQMARDLETAWSEQGVLMEQTQSSARQAQEHAHRLAAANALGRELASTFDQVSLCRAVRRYVESEGRGTTLTIGISTEAGGRVVPIYYWSDSVEHDVTDLSYESSGPSARSLRERVPVITGDAEASSLHLPLVAFERIVGLLTVGRDAPPPLGPEDLDRLVPVAAQVAVSLSNARLFEQVTRAKAEWEATFDGMSEAVFVFGPSRRLVRANTAAAALEGVPVVALVGRKLQAVAALSAEGPDLVTEAIEHGRRVVREIASRDRVLLVTVEPVRVTTGGGGAIAVARDMTDVRRVEEQAQRTGKLAAVGQLAAGVAHDFNNVLAAILGRAQLLKRRVTSPDALKSLDVIEKAALDGASTIRRLQNFAGRKSDEAFASVRLDDLARDTMELLKTRWRDDALAKGITYNVVLDVEPATVTGSASELREVLANLAINALDAMPDGGRLTLRCRPDGDRVRLDVQDSGSGMTEEVKTHIFEPFYTTKGHAGTGLGLAVSYGIIHRHEGTIEVDSTPGKGTVFSITLPTSDGGESRPAPADLPALRSLRSLVIDDEEMVRDTLLAILEELGHSSVGVASGSEGLALLAREPFDVVFTDLSMPEMDGLTVARRVREHSRAIKVLLVTGYGAALNLQGDTASLVDAIVNKPFALDQVGSALAEALEERV